MKLNKSLYLRHALTVGYFKYINTHSVPIVDKKNFLFDFFFLFTHTKERKNYLKSRSRKKPRISLPVCMRNLFAKKNRFAPRISNNFCTRVDFYSF